MSTIPSMALPEFVLLDRQIVVVDSGQFPSRHIGISLDNDEAQRLIVENFRVFCNEGGPYLVVRIPANALPIKVNSYPTFADVAISPRRWSIDTHGSPSGIICWLKEIL